MIFWKIYFFIIALLYVMGLLGNIIKPTLSGWIDMLVNTLTLVALFGFSFNKAILIRKFWQLSFLVCVCIEIFNIIIRLPRTFMNSSTIIFTSIWYLIFIPIYIAMFLYAFRRIT